MKKLVILLFLFQIISACSATKENIQMERKENENGIEFTYKPSNSVFSDFQLKIIPNDYNLEITEEKNQSIAEFITRTFPEKEITFEIKNKVDFADSGVNLEKITCPHCRREIEFEKWQEEMAKAEESDFIEMEFVTPCCKKGTSLNNLIYDSESGFSKYQITIINPDFDKVNQQELVSHIEKQTGLKMKLVWAQY
ncbi:hypothetical protein [Sabulibacter ruber]|uniref:hypothetical protein n=1 Tax=Sabulibacter ruber TaxID=2811901 RepID=UPI001A959E73|nr:hypothetical protein [Sabulibacter ruber]